MVVGWEHADDWHWLVIKNHKQQPVRENTTVTLHWGSDNAIHFKFHVNSFDDIPSKKRHQTIKGKILTSVGENCNNALTVSWPEM